MIPIIPAIIAVASGLALFWNDGDEKGKIGFGQPKIKFRNDVQPLSGPEGKALKKIATSADQCLLELRDKIEEFISSEFEFWTNHGDNNRISVHWMFKGGNNGCYIGKLVEDNLWDLLKKLREVDWDNEIETSKVYALKCDELGKEFHQISDRLGNA